MKEIISLFCELIGVITILCSICGFLILLHEKLKDFIQHRVTVYKRKHRFDKKPIAKCYCVDCIFRESNGLCEKGNINHAYDAWFCSDGIPHQK